MKSYSTVRLRVVGKDDDDDQEDGGVAHQCPECVSLKETADRRHNTVNNDGASPGPPEGLDSGEAGESEAEDGEEIPANTYQTLKKWVVGTPCAYVDGGALVGANGEMFQRDASFYDAEQRDGGNLACGRLSDVFKKDVPLMNTTIDELAAEVVSSDSKQQRKQRQVHYLVNQLESHTSRGVPGTAALMQRNVIRGLRHESGRRVGSAGKDIAADGYYVGLVLESRDGCLYETDDWVETHFEKSFIRAVKRQSLDKDGGFFGPGCCGFTRVDPGDPNNASLLFIKPIPYSSDGRDTTAPTNYVVKRLCYILLGFRWRKVMLLLNLPRVTTSGLH